MTLCNDAEMYCMSEMICVLIKLILKRSVSAS